MTTPDPILKETPYALQAHLGYRLTEWSPDFCRLEQPIEPYLLNRQGILHGGVLATLLDTAMGYCGCFTTESDTRVMAMTLNLSVNYLAQASGHMLIAEGNKTGGGAKTYFAEGRLFDDTGTLVATSTGVFRYRHS